MAHNPRIIRVAACQMAVTANIDRNVESIEKAISRAAEAGAAILAFPECAVSGYPPLHHKHPGEIDVEQIMEANTRVSDAAARAGIAVVVGTITASSEGLLNSALVILPDGEIAGRYDKLHLMPEDRHYFIPGWSVSMFPVSGVSLGVQICYDARFPEGFRLVREQGAELIVIISNACGRDVWKRPVLEGTYRARAAENSCFIVAVNAAGPQQMAESRIVDPLGLDAAAAQPDTEQDLIADIDLSRCDSGYFYDRRSDLFAFRHLPPA